MTGTDWESPGIQAGMRRMLAARADILASGGDVLGWKLGFGAPTWLEKFNLSGPLVGYLPAARSRPSGSTVSCEGWARAVAEPEIAVYFGSDVDDPSRADEAISGLGPAIELADVNPPPEDIEETLAGNIFHRAVILGSPDAGLRPADLGGMRARVTKDSEPLADTDDLQSLTGNLVDIVRHAAGLLAMAGERLRSGEVIIAGSVVPPIAVTPGTEIVYELTPLAPISVRV